MSVSLALPRCVHVVLGALVCVGAATCAACASTPSHHGATAAARHQPIVSASGAHNQGLIDIGAHPEDATDPGTTEQPGPIGGTGPGADPYPDTSDPSDPESSTPYPSDTDTTSPSDTDTTDPSDTDTTSPSDGDPGAADASVEYGDFQGSWTVSITRYDYCATGTAQASGTQSVTLAADLLIEASKDTGEVTETNPFSFILQAGNLTENGSATLASALVAGGLTPDSEGNDEALIQYWSFQQSGDEVTGTLNDADGGVDGYYNDLNLDKQLVPCRPDLGTLDAFPLAMADGTTMTGTISDGHVDLVIQGETTDGSAAFTAEFTS